MRFVVTAGPTEEPIDPVRYLSNRSSGRMGYAIAEAALEAGHNVTLISGRVNLAPPPNADFISILTSDEMHDAVHDQLPSC
ncbi:MAG: phosphopantothenoylcysteine decarboxylase / phosphopantothenate---cysteine ligase, partial [Verrucomicrobiota bacterium]